MATYRGIKGLHIQSVSSDPSTIQDGDIWYNTTLGKIKGSKTVAAWSSGGTLQTAKKGSGGCGIQTAALNFCGHGPSGYTLTVESYDGSSWTEINNTNTGRNGPGGFGTLTAAMCCGGSIGPAQPGTQNTEEFNGTSWTEQNNLTYTGRSGGTGVGIQTAGFYAAGGVPGDGAFDEVEFYDGTTWTEGPDLVTDRGARMGGWGTQTAAGTCMGSTQPGSVESRLCELYDGTSWTEAGDTNAGRAYSWGGGSVQTAGMVAGGNAGYPVNTPQNYEAVEQWDGSSWTEIADLSTGRSDLTGGGPNAAAIRVGGNNFAPGFTNETEEWNDAPATVSFDTT